MNIETLKVRAAIVSAVRRFFDDRGFVEVETAVRIPAPAPEEHIDCPVVSAADGTTYLRASPELQMKKLLAAEADFTVLEMDPRTLKGRELDHYLPADRAAECVPEADLLVITGVTVLNGTLPGLLELAKPGAEILVTGPTASMLPDAFFRRGVTTLGGIRVTKADEALDLLCEGGSGYHLFGRSAEQTVLRA